MGGGEVICGSAERKLFQAGVSGKGDERVEDGEGEASSLKSMATVSGYSEDGPKHGPPRVTEISPERGSRVLYSTGYAPEGSKYSGMKGL